MQSFLKKKPITIAGVITAIVLVITIISHIIGFNPITGFAKIVLTPFRTGISFIADRTYSIVEFLWEQKSYQENNAQLNEEIDALKAQNRDVAQYREENERLKELLGLQENMSQYSTVAARVIGYGENNRYDKIEINKGTLNGLYEGNTVISPDGVVGMVTEVGPNWAIVTTILAQGNAMGVRVTRTSDPAVLEGNAETLKEGACLMTFINESANIIAGDLLETSGSAGIYPPGLRVGTIKEINADNMGQINSAKVIPGVDFKRLYEVLVINGVNNLNE